MRIDIHIQILQQYSAAGIHCGNRLSHDNAAEFAGIQAQAGE
jgi:hypothetical protein